MSGFARELKLLEAFVNTNLPMFGYPVADLKKLSIGMDGNGEATVYVNYTDDTPSTNDVACFIRLKDAGSLLPTAMRTMSHAPGQYLHSSCICEVLCESPASWTGAHAMLIHNVMHFLRGVYGAPIFLYASANGTLIEIKGVNGAAADANIPAVPVAFGQGMGFVGGI